MNVTNYDQDGNEFDLESYTLDNSLIYTLLKKYLDV